MEPCAASETPVSEKVEVKTPQEVSTQQVESSSNYRTPYEEDISRAVAHARKVLEQELSSHPDASYELVVRRTD